MKRLLMFMVLILGYLTADAQGFFVVEGTVKDAETGEPLTGANIYLKAVKKGMATRRDGSYRLELPAGESSLALTFSYVGYKSETVNLTHPKDTVLNVILKSENILPDVNVKGQKIYFGASSSQMSAVGLSGEEVKRMPSFMGETDVMKVLQYIPGVKSTGDGQVGLNVRGGNYDENQILLDGIPIYNAEHLKGFVSALNPAFIDRLSFYKGAFPARYGGQLSSVIDLEMKEGDPERYRAELGVGLISSHLNVEGPVLKHTSFSLAGRYSYFQTFAMPIYERIAKSRELTIPYSNLNYYDLTARVSHNWNEGRNTFSALFYVGNDRDDTSPSSSNNTYNTTEGDVGFTNFQTLENSTRNSWGNILGGLNWKSRLSPAFSMETLLSYSRYHYIMEEKENSSFVKTRNTDGAKVQTQTVETSIALRSVIQEMRGQWDGELRTGERNRLQFGFQYSEKELEPVYDIYSHAETHGENYSDNEETDTVIGKGQMLHTLSFYAEDTHDLGGRVKTNVGIRLARYLSPGKSYMSLEPRASISAMLRRNMSLKLSFAYMSQGIHQLSSSNLVMPSDVWLSSSEKIPLTVSKQLALGYSWDTAAGMNLSVEGYYKWMDNLLEYKDGASFSKASETLENLVVSGRGNSYGVEFLLQKRLGGFTGWLGYTWSKSLRKFDRPRQELNGGNAFYASNDCRNNVSVVLNYKFNRYVDVSANWTYQTGRRGNITTTASYVNMPNQWEYGTTLDEITIWENIWQEWAEKIKTVEAVHSGYYFSGSRPLKEQYIQSLRMVYTYKQRNGFMLPSSHHLDVSVNLHASHVLAESTISLSLYNVYNRKNITQVYLGYVNNHVVLKGISQFPFMPSLQYSLKF